MAKGKIIGYVVKHRSGDALELAPHHENKEVTRLYFGSSVTLFSSRISARAAIVRTKKHALAQSIFGQDPFFKIVPVREAA